MPTPLLDACTLPALLIRGWQRSAARRRGERPAALMMRLRSRIHRGRSQRHIGCLTGRACTGAMLSAAVAASPQGRGIQLQLS